MEQTSKELLLKDLCARLPYGENANIMKEDYTAWLKKWSEEMEKKRLILRVSWNGLFGDYKDNCMELQKWLVW